MGTKRDDFRAETIRKAAGRVGYHCSFPGCSNATIGASMEASDKTSLTGVAAHICAAAKGGPRYDPDMSEEERRSIENCIWLCQTHSKLIDTDVTTYTVDLLRQWKSDAEAAASRALANSDYFAEYYRNNGDNLCILQQLFDDMIIDGRFDILHAMLGQYKTMLSEQYEEFILRYTIVHDVYCNRSQLSEHLDTYCNLSCKNGIDSLVELFFCFHLIEELEKIIVFCESEPLKAYANMALSGELICLLTSPESNAKTIQIPAELKTLIEKYLAHHIVQNKILGAIDTTGAKYVMFSKEFYYQATSAAYELACATIYGKGDFQATFESADFLFVKENLLKISILDVSLQEYIWGKLLAFLSSEHESYNEYYELCPSSLKTTPEIVKAHLLHQISCDPSTIVFDDLMMYVSSSGEDFVLCAYLSSQENGFALNFLSDHRYLYKQNSIYLKLKLDLSVGVTANEAYTFLLGFEEQYVNDFTFHMLLAKYATSASSLNQELEWLNARTNQIKSHDFFDYIQILYKHQRWMDLIYLSEKHLPNTCVFALAGYLSESSDNSHIKVSCALYQKLIKLGWKQKGLFFNLGVTQKQLGHFEEAKISFKNEFDAYADKRSLTALIQLRYLLNEYDVDEYFEQLKQCIDAPSQNLIAAIYLKRHNYLDANKYFLRSLLLQDTDNLSINGFYRTVSHLPDEDKKAIGENTFCTLENDNGVRHVAIHSVDVMDNINAPAPFAGYLHYSVQNTKISSILFAAKGDVVSYDGETFEVIEILSTSNAIHRFFFSSLSSREGITMIKGSTSEELIDQITDVLQKSSAGLHQLINVYNQLELRPSLSLLANATGKGRLCTCEFLAYENSEKIRNNLSVASYTASTPVFVLSYEIIVYLTHLGLDSIVFNDLNLACSTQVKNQLLNDINEELSELTDESQKGSMFYEDGKVALLEHTISMRRTRYAFLSRLKTFAESLRAINNLSSFSSNNEDFKDEIESVMLQHELYCESTTLAAAINEPNAILVTDDQFLFSLASLEGIPNTGLTGLFTQTKMTWSQLLSASKQLKNMNYSNYFPIPLYKRIVDQVLELSSGIETASAEIISWIISDTDEVASTAHEDIILSLYLEVIEQKLNYLNPESFLTNIVLGIWEKRNPGFVEQFVANMFMPPVDED